MRILYKNKRKTARARRWCSLLHTTDPESTLKPGPTVVPAAPPPPVFDAVSEPLPAVVRTDTNVSSAAIEPSGDCCKR